MHWVAYFGVPNYLMSDNGSQVTSEIMRDVAAIFGIRQVLTPSYHPEANGTVERLNQTLTAMIKIFFIDSQTDWDLFLPTISVYMGLPELSRLQLFLVLFLQPFWIVFTQLKVLLKIVKLGTSR
jgi:transposase InsO family protein